MKKKITVGMISYNDKKYLEYNLPALLRQDYENFEIIVCNNQPENEISKWINEEFPEVKVVSAGGNVGFGMAHNFMIELARKDSAYYLCFNSDMTIGEDYLSQLVRGIEKDEKIGCVTGKLISWSNFPDNPEKIEEAKIDTVGLRAFAPGITTGIVIDKGQGEIDKGQYENEEEIFGASGASPLYRIKALEDTAHSEGEYFDRNFFMYKEDVDLAFRLRWAGWKTFYVPKAVAWHDRTASDTKGIWAKIQAKRKVPEYIKKNSFINQLMVVKKFFSSGFSWRVKVKTWWFLFKYFVNLAVFNTSALRYLKDYWKVRAETVKKAKTMVRRVTPAEMEKWFG